jgi:hypothetical protein
MVVEPAGHLSDPCDDEVWRTAQNIDEDEPFGCFLLTEAAKDLGFAPPILNGSCCLKKAARAVAHGQEPPDDEF